MRESVGGQTKIKFTSGIEGLYKNFTLDLTCGGSKKQQVQKNYSVCNNLKCLDNGSVIILEHFGGIYHGIKVWFPGKTGSSRL